MLKGSVRIWKRSNLFPIFYEGQTHFSTSGMPECVWPSMNRSRMSFIQTSTLPPSMHQKLIKQGRCCMENNQLLTKSQVGLEDISIKKSPLPIGHLHRALPQIVQTSYPVGYAMSLTVLPRYRKRSFIFCSSGQTQSCLSLHQSRLKRFDWVPVVRPQCVFRGERGNGGI